MNQSKIAVRYAKALLSTATEQNQLEPVFQDISTLYSALNEVQQFGMYLKSPVVKPSSKRKFVTSALQNVISGLTLNFLLVLIDNKREAELENISRWFIHLYREMKGIKSATITTVTALGDSTKLKLMKMLTELYKSDVKLELNLNPSIIGGFILKVEDQQYDASVASGIKRMRTSLLSEINK
jgi:F-type H+-transporting ATPase subunit delta